MSSFFFFLLGLVLGTNIGFVVLALVRAAGKGGADNHIRHDVTNEPAAYDV